jgi:hypothetical protein
MFKPPDWQSMLSLRLQTSGLVGRSSRRPTIGAFAVPLSR